MDWKALHLFIHDTTFHNIFLADYLKPEIEALEKEFLLEQFFYIVYWQGGNHIRFRYKSKEPFLVESRVEKCFKRFLEQYEPLYVLDEEAYYKIYRNNKENVRDIIWIPDKTIKKMVYEPEIVRYGGAECMVHNEKIFSVSSRYALEIRKAASGSTIKRIIGSLDLFTVAIKQVEDKENFLLSYKKYWEEFAGGERGDVLSASQLSQKYKVRYEELMHSHNAYYDVWENVIKDEMNHIKRLQTTYPSEEIAYLMILASQIHMTNNRLGIIPYMESMLADVLYQCWRD